MRTHENERQRCFRLSSRSVTYIRVPFSAVDDWKTESDLVCFDEIIIVITHMGQDQLQLEAQTTVSTV